MTSDQYVPRLGAVLNCVGTCQREVDGGHCGAPATTHIIWTEDGENGVACSAHAAEAVVEWAPLWTHDYAADICGAPGSKFHHELNVCYFPPDEDGAPVRSASVTVTA